MIKRKVSRRNIKPKKPSILKRSGQWLIEITIILALIVGIQMWLQRDMSSGPAPIIKETSLEGSTLQLSNYKNKTPFIIHFWATWCPICQYEKNTINDIAKKWPLLSIATFEKSNSPVPIMKYAENNQITHWPTILDYNNSIAKQYGVNAVPSTYIVDRNGIIRFKTKGYTTAWGLKIRLWLTQLFYN